MKPPYPDNYQTADRYDDKCVDDMIRTHEECVREYKPRGHRILPETIVTEDRLLRQNLSQILGHLEETEDECDDTVDFQRLHAWYGADHFVAEVTGEHGWEKYLDEGDNVRIHLMNTEPCLSFLAKLDQEVTIIPDGRFKVETLDGKDLWLGVMTLGLPTLYVSTLNRRKEG